VVDLYDSRHSQLQSFTVGDVFGALMLWLVTKARLLKVPL